MVAGEALTENQQPIVARQLRAIVSVVMGVEERDITCSVEETGRRHRLLAVSYAVAVSIPETDPPVAKSVVMAPSQDIEEPTELANLGVRAETVSCAEEGEQQMPVLPSAGSKAVSSFIIAVFCTLALMLN